MYGTIHTKKNIHQPEAEVPQLFSMPSIAAAMAFPLSEALSRQAAIVSHKHFAISRIATTSQFSTTGKCLNFPAGQTILIEI